ncbi:hypothetical protein LIPSTDRAFT_155105 [Lipomyces starkeyi NRRL Y-11557]|uniref:Uncharacterized protein n=1 Tax=Lipomyces starkeyi NRRL Y-11557 TaxID=675824 RepID=A0A1E3PZ14_LIPST|nr:hypothetical protein LIPSTDRAFT_155105 [Lipomyces starkeyi NRRL Y-11557]
MWAQPSSHISVVVGLGYRCTATDHSWTRTRILPARCLPVDRSAFELVTVQDLRQALVAFLDHHEGPTLRLTSFRQNMAHEVQSGHSTVMAVTHHAIGSGDLPRTYRERTGYVKAGLRQLARRRKPGSCEEELKYHQRPSDPQFLTGSHQGLGSFTLYQSRRPCRSMTTIIKARP